jgi:hypothetical protein
LPETVIEEMMGAMKGFFNELIYGILAQSGLEGQQLE